MWRQRGLELNHMIRIAQARINEIICLGKTHCDPSLSSLVIKSVKRQCDTSPAPQPGGSLDCFGLELHPQVQPMMTAMTARWTDADGMGYM